jgi:hypothetical protein
MTLNARNSNLIVLALAALAGAHQWDRQLSSNVFELAGHTVLVRPRALVVVSPTGSRTEVGL